MSKADLETRIQTHHTQYEKKEKTTPFEAALVGLLREVLECDVCPPGTMAKLAIGIGVASKGISIFTSGLSMVSTLSVSIVMLLVPA